MRTCKTKEIARSMLLQLNKRSMKKTRKKLITFGGFIHEWLCEFKKPNVTTHKAERYQVAIDRIPEAIKRKPLQQADATELQGTAGKQHQPQFATTAGIQVERCNYC